MNRGKQMNRRVALVAAAWVDLKFEDLRLENSCGVKRGLRGGRWQHAPVEA